MTILVIKKSVKRSYKTEGDGIGKFKFQYGGKIWVLMEEKADELKFGVAPVGGGAAGDYLRRWRLRSDLTQAEAGDEFSVTQSAIARIESGTRPLSKKMIERIQKDYRSWFGRG